MKIKGVIEDLKLKKIIKQMIIVKMYLGISLELLQTVWGDHLRFASSETSSDSNSRILNADFIVNSEYIF